MIAIRKVIVDTHYLIWDLMGHKRFTKEVENYLVKNEGNCYISSISFWEVGMLVGKGRLSMAVSVDQFFEDILRKRSYKVLPITPEIGDITRRFSSIVNGDPADRIITASAIEQKAILLTQDQNLHSLGFIDIAAVS